MTRVEAHEKDCPVCQSGYKDHCYDREAAEFLDELQAAVKLWPKVDHWESCPSRIGDSCICSADLRNAARAQARQLLGMEP